MIYQGNTISVKQLPNGIAELCIDTADRPVNTLGAAVLGELDAASKALTKQSDLKGLIMTSGKPDFILGADIMEFREKFSKPPETIAEDLKSVHETFNRIEDLPFPSVAAINGYALGGGFELALVCDYRVASHTAKMGLPETKLGIFPGFGGTVRLPRLIGVDNAVQWIAGGMENKGKQALHFGAVDAVTAPELLSDAALDLLQQCISGDLDYRVKRSEKLNPVKLSPIESLMAFNTCKAMVAGKAGKHYPAPLAAVAAMEKSAGKSREDAIDIEITEFAKVAKSPVANALIGIFLNDQGLQKKAKTLTRKAPQIQKAAVLGAGIMGGGIAYQSAYRGVPIVMKDIEQAGIDLGLSEAKKLLAKRVARKRMSAEKMGEALNRIDPTLSYGDFSDVNIVVEAVIEKANVKQAVLAEMEKMINPDTVIASNTSTISISKLADALNRPENFCGMHFFNPVHKMPLVEVIRGEKTSDETIARTVAYAGVLGKKAVVVNDCPGFLVNRVLLPYMSAFQMLVVDGADFQMIDKVMEKWGWPMGPAYLGDVVGLDTGVHAAQVMAEGFPDRMKLDGKLLSEVMCENDRLGQKNLRGFYNYKPDKKGRLKKVPSPQSYELIKPHIKSALELDKQTIAERMMVPMCIELVRCLEDGIVATASEADMALVYGVGFPPFRGGVFHYMDTMGLAEFCAIADKYSHLGPLYAPTPGMRELAKENKTYLG